MDITYNQKMCTQPHFLQIKQILIKDHDHQEFIHRLNNSPINNNRYYLGLLLMTLVSLPIPKIEYIKTLIKFGADINFTEPGLQSQEIKIKKQLNEQIDISRSILMICCQKSVSINVNYLLSYQNLQVGYIDSYGRSALYYAVCNEDENQAVIIIRNILKQFPHLIQFQSKCTNSQQNNILFLSVYKNKIKILSFVLENYINCNHQFQPFGMTTLHYTISLSGQLSQQIIKNLIILLFKYKPNPKIQDHLSQTSYDYAEKYLFDLQEIIQNFNQQQQQNTNLNLKHNKCFTLNTYADSRTALSKDEDYFEPDQQIFSDKKIFTNLYSEIVPSNQIVQIDHIDQCQQIDQNVSQNSSQDNKSDYLYNFHYGLSNQIHNYYIEDRQRYQKAQLQIQHIYYQLERYGQEYLQLSLQIIGSFGSGLWTHHSDIDLAFINQKLGYINLSKKLAMVYKFLRINENKLGIIESYFNSQAKFPNIKLKLNQFYSYRRIEIVIFQKNCMARKYIHFIKESLNIYPSIPALYSVFHKLLETFQLHRAAKNGIKSYTLFLMILNACKAYAVEWKNISLSELFINIVCYFCLDFHYSCKFMESQGYKLTFNLIDPLNATNNTGGKQTDTQKLISMFQAVKYAIHIAIQTSYKQYKQKKFPILQYLFQLSRMFNLK